ncbi:MAG TPA: FAD-dependent oxidoreductase [Bryobacteraceae bacterium]|nr:FAD-dependent oxidoreductase [Bryobacteraceae bacterium]
MIARDIAADIAVIGAGVFGAWTALRLREAGYRVLLVDAWGPGHSRSSSGGESRIIRMGYGGDEIYTRMAMRSLPEWEELSRSGGEVLFERTGVLWIGRRGNAYSEATRRTLERAGVAIEILPPEKLAKRYPQMTVVDPECFGILEPESGALMARRAVAAVVREFVRVGGEYATAAVRAPAGRNLLECVETTGGERIGAGTFVFACGPWLPKLFPGVLGSHIHPTRQEVFFFAPPAGDRRFSPPQMPVWIDFTDPRGPYGFPDLEGRGCKLAFDRHGEAFDPDTGLRQLAPQSLAEARAFLKERFPGLADAPLTESRVCQYENTSSGDFLIDRHPDLENVWLVGGGSGHGFKHGPAVGEYVRGRICGEIPEEPRFRRASKDGTQSRRVY